MVNLAAALVKQGEKVICIDLGPQANITMSIGCHNPDELQHTIADGIDLMLSSIQLSGYETLLINENMTGKICCASMWTQPAPAMITSSLIASQI